MLMLSHQNAEQNQAEITNKYLRKCSRAQIFENKSNTSKSYSRRN